MTKTGVRILVLGPLEARVGDVALEVGGGRQRALLALLVLNLGEVVSSDRLVEGLWDGAPPATAHKALQNLVVQIRRTLGADGADVLVTQSPGYRLRLERHAVDAYDFEQRAREGARLLHTDPSGVATRLRVALELWRGEPYADVAYRDYAQAEIRRLNELRLGAEEDLVDAELALGGASDLVPDLEARLATHPLRERTRGQLMLALYRSGRQTEALDVYREGRSLLQDELGLEPGEPLRGLERAILEQDPALGSRASLPPPPARVRRSPGRRVWWAAAGVALLLAGGSAMAFLARGGEAAPTVVADSLVRIDAATNEIVEVVEVGREPGDVVAVGDYVFVSSEEDGTLTRVHTGSGEVTTTGAGADMGLAGAGDRFLWAVSIRGARVTRMAADRLLPIDAVPLPEDLAFAFVAVGGGSLWVSHYSPPALVRYRLRTLARQRDYAFGPVEVPVEIAYGFGAAWVGLGSSSALLRIDGRSGRTSEIPVGSRPSDPAVGFGSVWIASVDEGTVWRVDPNTEKTRATVRVGRLPFGVTTGAGSVWVANNCDGTVSRIDPATEEVVGTIETGLYPKWLTVAGDHAWVGISGKPFDAAACN